MKTTLTILLAIILRTGTFAAANAQAQPMPRGVPAGRADSIRDLYDLFITTIDSGQRPAILARLARTRPITTRELQRLFDLFMRFPNPNVRDAVMSSLKRLHPHSPHLERVIISYLKDPEPEAQVFGINAALITRSPKFLKPLRKIAKGKFPGTDPNDLVLPSEINAWWARYEALSALAQIEGDKAFRLIKKQARKAPRVSAIMGTHFWVKSLPYFVRWSASRKEVLRRMAQEGLKAPVDHAALRETRERMLKILHDDQAPRELRHRISIKVGRSSTEEEVTGLLTKYRASKDADERLSLSSALFASRSPQVIPLLKELVREDPDSLARMGARQQLADMLEFADYIDLLEWVANNDSNPDVRENASDELKRLRKDEKP